MHQSIAIQNADQILREAGLPTYSDFIIELVNSGNKIGLTALAAAVLHPVLDSTAEAVSDDEALQKQKDAVVYPLSVQPVSIDGAFFWTAVDLRTAERGPARLEYNTALFDIQDGRVCARQL